MDQMLAERGVDDFYDDAHSALNVAEAKALGAIEDRAPYLWRYERNSSGDLVSRDPQAPPWSTEAWRADRRAEGESPERIAQLERSLLGLSIPQVVFVTRSEEARAQVRRIEAQRAVVEDAFECHHEALDARYRAERAAFGESASDVVRKQAANIYPGVAVQVETSDGQLRDPGDYAGRFGSPEARLLERGRQHTPLPGSGTDPTAYRPRRGTDVLRLQPVGVDLLSTLRR